MISIAICDDDKDVIDGTAKDVTDGKNEDVKPEKKLNKIVYYVTDVRQQSQYIKLFKDAKMNAVILQDNIDQPFISQLEASSDKNELRFMRIDADVSATVNCRGCITPDHLSFNALQDSSLPTCADGQILIAEGPKWVCSPALTASSNKVSFGGAPLLAGLFG